MRVCFMGLGYIGLPTAIIAAQSGIEVTGVDINPKVVELTNRGVLHIVEPGLQDLCREVVKTGKLKACVKPVVSDAYFIVVPTPFKGNHEPDISYVEAATRSIIPLLKEGDLYVIESTSPVGTTEKMKNLIFSSRPDLKEKIFIAYCPERVLPGNVIYELVHNDRVIGGINPESTEKAVAFYAQRRAREFRYSFARVHGSGRYNDRGYAFAGNRQLFPYRFSRPYGRALDSGARGIRKPRTAVFRREIRAEKIFRGLVR